MSHSCYTVKPLLLLLLASQTDGFSFQSKHFVVNKNMLGERSPTTCNNSEAWRKMCTDFCFGSILAVGLASASAPAIAVSGGGLDYAGLDISGQDFSNNSKLYKGKDFTGVLAKATNFANSNLQGCRFYNAYLIDADFSNSDIRGAALERTNMEGANLKNAVASGAYFDATLLYVSSAENADFTDATIPVKTLASFCEREDVKGTNPITGEDTRDSLMCP